ncbi:hypothetical protein ACFLT9_01200 [Acidobacteriota bacterium]
MTEFLEIKSLSSEEEKKILTDIEKRIADKVKSGILKEKEVREIEEMRLRPPADILDVQSVFSGLKFDD